MTHNVMNRDSSVIQNSSKCLESFLDVLSAVRLDTSHRRVVNVKIRFVGTTVIDCVHSCSDDDRLLWIAPPGPLDETVKAIEISFELIQANWVDFFAIVYWFLQLDQT